MRTLDLMFDPDNLARAWRWLRSNPLPAYKGYFRTLYRNYAVADTGLLEHLHDRLVRGVYEPAHSCKIFFPKANGVLRPYTLLTVEDQIVYQAMVNVVAEKLFPKVRTRYLVETFGHLYAGKSSIWFYRKWQHGYAACNRAARKAVADGFRFRARFDLTAFYDSVDHGVLRHFLLKIGCDKEFCDILTPWLSRWTATQRQIYHNHGIPQGPLGSGLLAEVVLQHFDRHHGSPNAVRYLRYVDDIRLFARTEKELRRMVTKLDLLSKDVGLFPQSAKIEIGPVEDIEKELKTISRPFEEVYDREAHEFDQGEVRRRLRALSPRGVVEDTTQFKFLLGVAAPTAELNDRLWQVMERHPELYDSVMRYFQRYPTLPQKVGRRLLEILEAKPLYAAVVAELIQTAEGRLREGPAARMDRYVAANWRPQVFTSADHIAALGRWAIRRRLLSAAETEHAVRNLKEWWARAELVGALEVTGLGVPTLASILNAKLCDEVSDVAIAAAAHIARLGLRVMTPWAVVNPLAARVLEAFGILPTGSSQVCGIQRSFTRMVGETLPPFDWRQVFGKQYSTVERHVVWCRALADTDVTAWVNAMDVFNDHLLTALYAHDTTLGTYTTGKVGSIVSSTRLAASYPAVLALIKDVHEKRWRSALSHAWTRKGKRLTRPTARIKYRYIFHARALLAKALKEVIATW